MHKAKPKSTRRLPRHIYTIYIFIYIYKPNAGGLCAACLELRAANDDSNDAHSLAVAANALELCSATSQAAHVAYTSCGTHREKKREGERLEFAILGPLIDSRSCHKLWLNCGQLPYS